MTTDYNGEPIDMAWKSGPWANEGETVDIVDSDGGGQMQIDDWPEGATDPEKLNEDQRAVIMATVRNPGVKHASQIADLINIDKSRAYPNWVLSEHWPGKHKDIVGESSTDVRKKIPDGDIESVRRRALGGESIARIADDYDSHPSNVWDRVSGNTGDDSNSDIPPLVGDTGHGTSYKLPGGIIDSILENATVEPEPDAKDVHDRIVELATEYEVPFDEAVRSVRSRYVEPGHSLEGSDNSETGTTESGDDEKETETDTDIEPSPVYGSTDGQETTDNSKLKSLALVAAAFALGLVVGGGSE